MSTQDEPVWAFLEDVPEDTDSAARSPVATSSEDLAVLAAAVTAIEEGLLPTAPGTQPPEDVASSSSADGRRTRSSTTFVLVSGILTLIAMVVFGLSLTTGSAGVAQLMSLDGGDVVGSAVRDGRTLTVDVTLPPLAAGEGSYVVWLFDDEVTTQISLGRLADDGVHEIPPDVDLAAVRVVDVSVQPAGRPGAPHSGRSVARGVLE